MVTVIAIALLGFLIQTNTQTTITTFAQSGGFVGADRLADQLSEYYLQYGSWQGVESYVASLNQGEGQNAQDHSGGQGTGQGSGQGGGNRFGSSGGMGMGMGMGGVENYTLTDASGAVIYTQNPDMPAQFSESALKNAIPITAENQTVGYLIPENTLIDLSSIISENLTQALSNSFFTTVMISSAVALILAIIFTYIFMQPIRQLTTAAQKLGEGDLSQRVKTGGSSEIKQMANTFNQMAESLQNANQARKSMTADIAHELRNPLSVQRANLEALQDGVYPLTIENLEPIVQQNVMLTQLVEDLRTLALADAESLALDRQPVELNSFLQQLCENFKPQFEQNGLQLTFNPDPEHPTQTLTVDHQRITQIISNLLQNARRHTPTGGNVHISLQDKAETVSIAVKDSGEGIPPESLAQIFDRFYRADQSRARDKGGTGLGLSIARHLAEAHHGTLTAENAPEGGAVFTLTLPKKEGSHDHHK
jgi:two-component system OmpR family sensor kinase/two-component system sensor histidine kinase BaeS